MPKPVPNIGCGVYSNAIEDDESADFPSKLRENITLSKRFTAVSDPETLLHLALESFHGRLDAQKLIKGRHALGGAERTALLFYQCTN